MSRLARFIGIAVISLGIAALAMGVAFVVEGQSKANYIKEQMRAEQVTLAILRIEGADPNNLIDSAAEAEKVANKVKEHRLGLAPPTGTYSDLMALSPTGKYDPAIPQHLQYSQAMNLENYLYLGVASLGLTTVTIVSGIFMMVTGLGLSLIGFAVQRLAKRLPATA
jgi:hypothetical protein